MGMGLTMIFEIPKDKFEQFGGLEKVKSEFSKDMEYDDHYIFELTEAGRDEYGYNSYHYPPQEGFIMIEWMPMLKYHGDYCDCATKIMAYHWFKTIFGEESKVYWGVDGMVSPTELEDLLTSWLHLGKPFIKRFGTYMTPYEEKNGAGNPPKENNGER